MLSYVIQAAGEAGVNRNIVIVGHEAETVRQTIGTGAEWATQPEQLGTGHAVMQAERLLSGFTGSVLVLCGDTPLITAETLALLMKSHLESGNAATVLTAVIDDPSGYGRIVRDDRGQVSKIVEHKDASADQLSIREINTGIYCFAGDKLFDSLKKINPANAQGEYYLTDVLAELANHGEQAGAVQAPDPAETMGINDRVQLAEAEKAVRRRTLDRFMREGVTIIDPQNTYIDSEVIIGPDSVVFPGTIIEGGCRLGDNCRIGPYSHLTSVEAGDGVAVQNSVIVESTIGNNVTVGPFSYIRPGTVLEDGVKVGDFVEIKKSIIGAGSKVPHLSYVGDAQVGERVNIGAGTITCNYDGVNKWQTVIGDDAFIGSNTNLVAPVKVGSNTVIGAGSTITKDVPDGALAVERAKQEIYPDRVARKNQKK